MNLSQITVPVSSLSGIGPSAAKAFSALNIFTVSDLLQFYPKDYDDRTLVIPFASWNKFPSQKVHTIAQVINHTWIGNGNTRTLKIIVKDLSGQASLVAFNRPFLQNSLPVGSIVCITGKFEIKYNELQSSSFETIKICDNGVLSDFQNQILPDQGLFAIYPLTSGLTQKTIRKAVDQALSKYTLGLDDDLPQELITKHNLLTKKDSLQKLHRPQTLTDIQTARKTLIYEELFFFQKNIAQRALLHKGRLPDLENSSPLQPQLNTDFSPRQKELLESLTFSLTKDQISVISTMNAEIDRGYKERTATLKSQNAEKLPYTMARLVQGDVGCGKTLVALFAALRITDWGGQTALMAPTEILARQHAENIARLTQNLKVRTAFLTGNVKAAGRSSLLKALKAGEIDILIGTHALFSRDTVYNDLQLAIIDEQHRFGVMQRQAIVEKGRQLVNNVYSSPHLLMMSATPIPQSLALTAFGDLDISTIKTMPNGRKPITTYLVAQGHEANAYNAVRQELEKGHQAYFVYPAIGNDEDDDDKTEIKNAQDAFKNLSRLFSGYKCALIHSKVEEDVQSRILEDFRTGKINLIAATTVVEVGVDVPNATCMVIEEADRFGLSTLHQLRGRVGRGKDAGYCFLIYRKDITQTGIDRMKVLHSSTDGFYIAEQDLKLRGPGEITGTAQTGNLTLGIADLSRDQEILYQARADAFKYVNS